MGSYRFILIAIFIICNLPLYSEIASWKSYKVSKGDSLYQVARKFKVTINELYSLNPDKKKNPSLYTGEILKIPTKYSSPNAPASQVKAYFQFPLEKRVSIDRKFSGLSYAPHKGVSFRKTSVPIGVMASRGGKVVTIDYMDGYGNYIVLEHFGGYYSVYGNIGKILVNEGQNISPGQKIGLTEKKNGLYFQLSLQDRPVDPLPYIL
ncbi:MAG: peptidoglycan DD-metalloendopeptidase family protein [Leptospira sp.]|nr:peptidoglycan DD-metalloendopeptidase family protein [Leptospira sp.]